MNYKEAIEKYKPINEQEEVDKKVILDCINKYGNDVLTRDCEICHLTSSAIIINETKTKVLAIHHNIYNSWGWVGGHADGDEDLLKVAIKEAKEETSIQNIKPLDENICSIDTLSVWGHVKRGKYVSAHIHLSVAYLLVGKESDDIKIKEDENSGVKWMSFEEFIDSSNEPNMKVVYRKILNKIK